VNQQIVAFQGEHGAYSEEAIHQYFGSGVVAFPCESFADIFRTIQRGDAAHGMLPVENSLAGTVAQAYELLIEYDFRVQAEFILPIRHHLLAPAGTTVQDVRFVKSHPQALAQCTEHLHRRGWEPVVAYDTAGAARELSLHPEPNTAVVASAIAADLYGLQILESGMEDEPDNFTRFFVIGVEDAPRKDPSKTSLVFTLRHQPSALYECLGAFARHKINLTKIESRPIRHRSWQYWFYLDFEGHWQDNNAKAALLDLLRQASMVKMLGSYPAAKLNGD